MVKIVFPEPAPSLNKGEAAILGGILKALELVKDYHITVYSPSGWYKDDFRNYKSDCEVVTGIDLCDMENNFLDKPKKRGRFFVLTHTWGRLAFFSLLYRIFPKLVSAFTKDKIFRAFYECDIVLAGHDGMFSYSQFYPALVAKILGKKFILFGGGTDGVKRENFKNRFKMHFAVKNAELCTVRDKQTYDYIMMNGVPAKYVNEFPDSAALLPIAPKERAAEILKTEGAPQPDEKELFGLIPVEGGIVAHESFSECKTVEEKHEKRVALWAALLDHLLERTEAHFVFLPHCIGPVKNNDDRIMSKDIYDAVQGDKSRLTLLNNEYSASEMKGVMNVLTYILGERTHGLIGAVSAATPCMALTVKRDNRMHYIIREMFNRPTENLDDPDIEKLKSLLIDEWNKRNETAKKMKEYAQQIHDKGMIAAELLKKAILD